VGLSRAAYRVIAIRAVAHHLSGDEIVARYSGEEFAILPMQLYRRGADLFVCGSSGTDRPLSTNVIIDGK
jgi:GGDEF domain-containing protein